MFLIQNRRLVGTSSNADNVFSKLKSAYHNTAWVGDLEDKHSYSLHKFWKQAHGMIKPENFQTFDKKIRISQNIAYLFQNGKITHKYNKTVPFKRDFSEHVFFNPGEAKNSNLFIIKHPVAREDILCAVEICRDHGFRVVAHKLAENPVHSIPMLHIIISDSISIDSASIASPYTIQQDALDNSRFIVSNKQKPEHKHCQVFCLSHDLFDNSITYKHIPRGFLHAPQNIDESARSKIQQLVEEKPSIYVTNELFFALRNAIWSKDIAAMELLMKHPWIGQIFNNYKSMDSDLIRHTTLKEIAKKELDPEIFNKLPLKNYRKIYDYLKDGPEKYSVVLKAMDNDPGLWEFVESLPEEVGENFREFLS